jgi:hypothetical protein
MKEKYKDRAPTEEEKDAEYNNLKAKVEDAINNGLEELKSDSKRYFEYKAMKKKLLREGTLMEKIVDGIWQGFSWISDRVADNVPVVGEYIKLDNLKGLLVNNSDNEEPIFKGDIRRRLDKIDEVMEEYVQMIRARRAEGTAKGPTFEELCNTVSALRDKKIKYENMLEGSGVSGLTPSSKSTDDTSSLTTNYYFCSYGSPPPEALKNYLKSPILGHTFQIQEFGSNICGELACLWLRLMDRGIHYFDVILSLKKINNI